jgi:hypothetical protein
MATTLSVPEAMALLSRAAPELTLDESDVEGLILAVHALAKVEEPAVIGAVGEALLRQEIIRFVWWPLRRGAVHSFGADAGQRLTRVCVDVASVRLVALSRAG